MNRHFLYFHIPGCPPGSLPSQEPATRKSISVSSEESKSLVSRALPLTVFQGHFRDSRTLVQLPKPTVRALPGSRRMYTISYSLEQRGVIIVFFHDAGKEVAGPEFILEVHTRAMSGCGSP